MERQNSSLQRLKARMSRLEQIDGMLEELSLEQEELLPEVSALEDRSMTEQADVDRLEREGLTSFFYRMLGRHEEKLDKERQEAREAQSRFQEAMARMDSLRFRISALEEERRQFGDLPQRYERALEEKKNVLNTGSDPMKRETLQRLEEAISRIKAQQQQIREAIAAGKEAGMATDAILRQLEDAEGWGVMDVMGGGLISDMAKYSALDEAQKLLEGLQEELKEFKNELADIDAMEEFRIQIDGFLRFADCFFDGFLADWTVLDQIQNAKKQVETTRSQIIGVLDHLDIMMEDAQTREASALQELEDWLLET